MISTPLTRDPVHSIQSDVSQGEIKTWKLHQYLYKFSLQPPRLEEKNTQLMHVVPFPVKL